MRITEKVVSICLLLDEKKAQDIVVCDTTKMKNAVNYFIIASADSIAHVRGVADYIEEKAKESEILKDYYREGYEQSDWVVFDFDDIFLHIFTKDARERYSLQKMLNEGGNIFTLKRVLNEAKKKQEKEAKRIDLNLKPKKIKDSKK